MPAKRESGQGGGLWLFLRLDVWLVAFPAVYAYLVLYTEAITKIPEGHPRGTVWGDVIGLFVPIGPNNFLAFFYVAVASLSAPSSSTVSLAETLRFLAAFAGVLFVFMFGEYVLRTYVSRSAWLKIAANLVVLLTVTLIVDLFTVGKWMSMLILLYAAGGPKSF